jgi:hypothetical protein
VIEHVDPLEAHKAVRYFGDGQMLWLLTRRGDQTGEAFVDQSADAANLTAEERVERAQEYETPTGTRAEFSTWAVAGFPIVQMTRSDLILEPFRGLDLATLNRVSEDEEAWVFEAKIDSPAFAPMETAELRIEKSSGLLEWMRVKGATLEASIEFSGIQSGVDLPASTFVVPQAPEGRSFRVVDAPDSPSEALTLLGAL